MFRESIFVGACAGSVLAVIFYVSFAPSAKAGRDKVPNFERDIQPILQSTCLRCHGDKHSGDLDLRTLSGLLKGGESGPALVPGHSEKSLLFKKVHEGLMPPDKKGTLKPEQIATIRRWIDAGAPSNAGTAAKTDKGLRRSIYVRQRRTQILTLLETFDLPQMNPNCIERFDSTVATQALFLRNNALVQELAEALAARVKKVAGTEPTRQVEQVYRIALNRAPSSDERKIGVQALADLAEHWSRQGQGTSDDAARRALANYCHTIMNSAAFLYID